jgi:hypothetical protein
MPFTEDDLIALGFHEWPDGSWKKDTPPPKAPAKAPGPRHEAEATREVKDLHDPFKLLLDGKRIPFVYSRPDKPTGQRKGLPDFIFAVAGIPVAIEFKLPGKKPRKDQRDCMAEMEANGWQVSVQTDLQAAWAIVLEILNKTKQ